MNPEHIVMPELPFQSDPAIEERFERAKTFLLRCLPNTNSGNHAFRVTAELIADLRILIAARDERIRELETELKYLKENTTETFK